MDIFSCKINEKAWQCPNEDCKKILSRKQTLLTHIQCFHPSRFNQLEGGHQSKRYKLYEIDETVPMPKRTFYRRKTLRNDSEEDNGLSTSCVEPDEMPTFEEQIMLLPNATLEQAPDPDEIETILDDLNDAEHSMDLVNSDDEDSDDEYDADLQSFQGLENDTINKDHDPPIFVIPASDTLFKCPIPRSEYLLAASALISKYNMSATMAQDVLKFSQIGMPEQNLCETSFDRLQQSCGFDANYMKYHLYCGLCKKLFDLNSEQETCKTPGCNGSKTNSCSYFVTGKLNIQFQEVLERDGLWESIEELKHSSSASVSDISSGESYKKLKEPGGFLDDTSNITLSMFIDGIPLYSSSSISLWPVYLLINEIPPKKRFRKKNMLLWGVWQGAGKPNMNMFLRPMVIDLYDLYTKGVAISVKFEDHFKEINVKVMLIVATMDLQARAYVVNMTQHNGEYGCLYCMESGQVVSSGKGYCRAYLTREQSPSLRTDEMARLNAIQARQTGSRTEGFLGESVLWYLPYFSFVNNIVIDYMHGILLGVTKKFLDYWFDSKFKDQPFYIGKNMTDIDKLMRQIQPLYVIHRLPRILSNTYHHWKASELRNWLLFYSLPCLQDFLPFNSVYHTHFSCLVEATYLLLTEGLTSDDLARAELLLGTFVKNVQRLYGDNAMSLNVHNLTHLVHFVRQWGPLWAWSCFSFESFNGEIKRSVHGTGNVCRQIFWALQAQKRVESRTSLAKSSRVKNFLHGLQDSHAETFGKDAEAFQCSVVKSSTAKVILSQEVKDTLKSIMHSDRACDYLNISKIARNGFQMYCKGCTRVKKQNSYTIKLNATVEGTEGNGDIIVVANYVMEKKSRKVFAIGQLMISVGSILPRRAPHLQTIEYVGNYGHQVVAAETLQEPMMVVKGKTALYAALLPNNNERD